MVLAEYLEELKAARSHRVSKWKATSTYKWIRNLSCNDKGKVGEQISRFIYEDRGHTVIGRTDTRHDFNVDGERHEVKLGTPNENGMLKWGHIRTEYEYAYLTLISVYPDQIKMWRVPKAAVRVLAKRNIIMPFKAKPTTASDVHLAEDRYLPVRAAEIPRWLDFYKVAFSWGPAPSSPLCDPPRDALCTA